MDRKLFHEPVGQSSSFSRIYALGGTFPLTLTRKQRETRWRRWDERADQG